MNKAEIQQKIANIIVDKMCEKPENVKSESRFREDLGMDSLDVVELTMEAEKEFKITISDQETYDLTTVESLVNVVDSKLNGK